MSKFWHPITACLKKSTEMEDQDNSDINSSDKDKKCETKDAPSGGGMIWKVSSGLYNLGSGAVGVGVGSVKWAASTTYSIGSGVVSATQNVVSKVIPATAPPKPKKE